MPMPVNRLGVLVPGQISVHHVKIFHGSSPNRSGERRIGFAIRYVTPKIIQKVGTADSATLVRGEDRFGHFELEDAPETDYAPAALATHRRLREQRMAVLMRKV